MYCWTGLTLDLLLRLPGPARERSGLPGARLACRHRSLPLSATCESFRIPALRALPPTAGYAPEWEWVDGTISRLTRWAPPCVLPTSLSPATAFPSSVSEPATADHRLRTVLGMPYTDGDEPEMLTGLHSEGFAVVGHIGEPTGAALPVSTCTVDTMVEVRTGGDGRRPHVAGRICGRCSSKLQSGSCVKKVLRPVPPTSPSSGSGPAPGTTGIQVTNASVIGRIWENQAEFQADVLAAVANDQSRPELGLIFNALGPLLQEADLSNPESASPARATGLPSGWSRQHCHHGRVAQLSALDACGRNGHYDLRR